MQVVWGELRDGESTLACWVRAGRAGQSFPLFSQLSPLSPIFVPVLGTPEKAGLMQPFRPHHGPQDGRR